MNDKGSKFKTEKKNKNVTVRAAGSIINFLPKPRVFLNKMHATADGGNRVVDLPVLGFLPANDF